MDDGQIPRLTLPSGGTIDFRDLDDLTAADMHDMRKVIRSEDSAGATSNALYIEAIHKTVKTWDIPYLIDPRTPEANPAAWKKLRIRDMQALEAHLQPVLALLRAPEPSVDDQRPGSPTQPASD